MTRPVLSIVCMGLLLAGCTSGTKQEAIEHFDKGRQFEADSMYSKAIGEYRKAIETDPDFRDAHFQMGTVYEKLGVPALARIAYEEALRIDDDFASAFNNLGNVLGQLGNLDSAILVYRLAIEKDEKLASAHYNLGHAYMLKKEMRLAETEFGEAIRLNPLEPRYQKGMALFMMTIQKPEDAVVHLRKARQYDSTDSDIPYHLSLAYESLRQYDDAIVEAERFLAVQTDLQERIIAQRRVNDLKTRRIQERLAAQRQKVQRKPVN